MSQPRIRHGEDAGHGGPAHKAETCGRGLCPPRIGLNCDLATASGVEIAKVNWSYIASVLDAGGLPVLLVPVAENSVGSLLEGLDGLVLTGGRDYDPASYGEPRHPGTQLLDPRRIAFDLALARGALARGMPILGICGGAQLINIALGGTLIQHIPDAFGAAIVHQWGTGDEPFHDVEVAPDSRLARTVGAGRARVNSSHHQAVGRLGDGLRIVAHAPDGVPEAIEGATDAFLLGIQWHPERLRTRPDQTALFRALVAAAAGA